MRETSTRLRLAMEASALGMWSRDLDRRHYLSPECYAIFGVRPEEFNGTGQGVDALIHPEDRGVSEPAEAVQQRTTDVQEFRILRPTGEVRWVATRGRAEYDVQGKPTRMIGTVADIPEGKQTERVLHIKAGVRTSSWRCWSRTA